MYELPLITPLSAKYYIKATKDENEEYYKAIDIRICLEKICDEMVKEFVSLKTQSSWSSYKTLHSKLIRAKEFMPDAIVSELLNARLIGNKGAHEGEESIICENDIDEALSAIFEFSLEIFVYFFKKNGFDNFEGNSSWMPVVFSTLPPTYRIKILEKYFVFNHSLFVIDKLSMAYLKNNEENQVFKFLSKCLENGYITDYQHLQFVDKLNILKTSLNRLPIAKNLEMAKENFNLLVSQIPENERDNFIFLVSMILNGKHS